MKLSIDVDDDLIELLNFLRQLQAVPATMEQNIHDMSIRGVIALFNQHHLNVPPHYLHIIGRKVADLEARLAQGETHG